MFVERRIDLLERSVLWRRACSVACGLILAAATTARPVVAADDPSTAEMKMLRETVKKQADTIRPLRAKIDELQSEVKGLKAQLAERDGQMKALEGKIRELTAQMEKATEARRNAIAKANAGKAGDDPLTEIPLQGDEMPVANIQADPKDYVGREVIVCGAVGVNNYYNFGYRGTEDLFYAFGFRELSADGVQGTSLTIHVPKAIGKPLVDAVAKSGAGRWKAARLRITLRPRGFQNGEWHEQAEASDWQFLTNDRSDWDLWDSEHRREAPAPAHNPPARVPQRRQPPTRR